MLRWKCKLLVFLTCLVMLPCYVLAGESCISCHDPQDITFTKNTHAQAQISCVACHGEAPKHREDPEERDCLNMKDPAQVEHINKACLACHEKSRKLMFWEGSQHASNNVACTACHKVHTDGSHKVTPESCYTCHKNIRRDLKKFSHHPIEEGKLQCSSCHNMHGSLGPSLLITDNINSLCYSCHTEKRGPFRFAHAPVEENCLNCHVPHGSNSARLTTQHTRTLCQSCHSFAQHNQLGQTNINFRGTGVVKRSSCLGCHGDVHGSNTDYHFR